MKVCIYGAGAIGGHLAGRLAKGGAEVSVVARGAHLAALRENGLRVEAADGVMQHRVAASDNPAELGVQDAVLVCTKVPALASVAAGIGPLLGPETSVTFVTNGIPWWYFDRHGGPRDGDRMPEVDPGDVIRRAVGVERTLGGVIYSACNVAAPGVIEVSSKTSKLIIGEPSGQRTPRAVNLAGAFKAGGLPCSVSADIRTDVWGKLLNNLSNGPLCLISRRNIRDTFANPVVREAALRVVNEAMAVAAAMGRPVPGQAEDRINLSIDIPHKPSILQDLEAGRPMEIDSLFNAPLRLARECGVATPTLALTVALATHGAIAAGIYQGSTP
jgi:2-dehydropantoate 2-reductase